jgi:NADH-quinone oxidoreductase subunit L
MSFEDYLIQLLILPPFIGAIISWLFDKKFHGSSKFIGILTISISGITSLICGGLVYVKAWNPVGYNLTLLSTNTHSITLKILPDELAVFMSIVAAFLGMLIAIFSYEYMQGDENLTRYWFYLQLFIGGMLILVNSADFILMYTGWEIVGLCSFGLISHWHNKKGEEGEKCKKAGIKAFIFTRIGDIGFLTAVVMIYGITGAVDFETVIASTAIETHMLDLITVLLLIAAFGKSAQIPFIPWLSSPENIDIDAMQGPTTVSALIHAATMVKAGVYLVSRLYILFPLNQLDIFIHLLILGSGLTAIIAALSALTSFDIKRILAFSTVSQLAFMFLSLGIASISTDRYIADHAFIAAQFHLISHAIFKSLLFLSAGYLIHKTHQRSIMDLKGQASWKSDKFAFIGIFAGSLALAAIPPFNGYFSKESILAATYEAACEENLKLAQFAYSMALVTAVVTTLYTGRFIAYLIGYKPNEVLNKDYPLMKAVIVILVCLTLIGGVLLFSIHEFFGELVQYGKLGFGEGIELIIAIIVTIVISLSLLVSYIATKDYNTLINRVVKTIYIRWIVFLSEEGFFMEKIWNYSFYGVKYLCFKFKRVHTGDLNIKLAFAAGTCFLVIFALVGGAL